jgi:P4 family phage/plasmid primase-like protien
MPPWAALCATWPTSWCEHLCIKRLRTGQLCPPGTEDYSLRWTPVPYEPGGRCRRWRRFIAEVMGGDREMMRLLQRIAGYAATGSSIEQSLPIFSGSGNNGKGVYLRMISRALGDYALAAHPDFLHKKRYHGHPTDIAQLQGTRLVVVSELAAGEGLDEARLKVLTGGDILRGRQIAQDFSEFAPTFTVVLQTNNLPVISGFGGIPVARYRRGRTGM